MEFLQQSFSVRFEYRVHFTRDLFNPSNDLFRQFLRGGAEEQSTQKILFVIDEGVDAHHPDLQQQIRAYFRSVGSVALAGIVVIPGGEEVKNNSQLFLDLIEAINQQGIDRHSYVAAIGGGAVLDLCGYVAAVAHRGIRHIRIPTTVLAQNDSGVGVKNGINYMGKKNFLGTFCPPVAVFNDADFLATLSDVDWRAGISEAVKVALIKDQAFFHWLEANAAAMAARNMEAMQYQIRYCARLHLEHIAGTDPFEQGSSRPLDFGHWSAHKLEQLSEFSLRHGEAVAIGIALDSTYSYLSGWLPEAELIRILELLQTLGLPCTHPLMQVSGGHSPLLVGLDEFREHLGGRLTIMLLKAIGRGEEVHHLDKELIAASVDWLHQYHHPQKQEA